MRAKILFCLRRPFSQNNGCHRKKEEGASAYNMTVFNLWCDREAWSVGTSNNFLKVSVNMNNNKHTPNTNVTTNMLLRTIHILILIRIRILI